MPYVCVHYLKLLTKITHFVTICGNKSDGCKSFFTPRMHPWPVHGEAEQPKGCNDGQSSLF